MAPVSSPAFTGEESQCVSPVIRRPDCRYYAIMMIAVAGDPTFHTPPPGNALTEAALRRQPLLQPRAVQRAPRSPPHYDGGSPLAPLLRSRPPPAPSASSLRRTHCRPCRTRSVRPRIAAPPPRSPAARRSCSRHIPRLLGETGRKAALHRACRVGNDGPSARPHRGCCRPDYAPRRPHRGNPPEDRSGTTSPSPTTDLPAYPACRCVAERCLSRRQLWGTRLPAAARDE